MAALVENDGFYGAARARQIAMGGAGAGNTILAEIQALQTLVDISTSSGNLDVDASATPMASDTAYFAAWNDPYNNATSADRLRREEMNTVVSYFSRLGYAIKRNRVGVTNFFSWHIEW